MIPSHRLAGLEPFERALVHATMTQLIAELLEGARHDLFPQEARQDAANTLVHASRLAFDIDDLEDRYHPPLESLAQTVEMIAAGTYGDEFRATIIDAVAAAEGSAELAEVLAFPSPIVDGDAA